MKLTKIKGFRSAGAALLIGASLLGAATAASASSPSPSESKAAPASSSARPMITGTSVSIAPGSNLTATVTCPAGTVVTGGGGTTSAYHIFFTDSFRSGNGWAIRGTNMGTANESLTANAVCVGIVA